MAYTLVRALKPDSKKALLQLSLKIVFLTFHWTKSLKRLWRVRVLTYPSSVLHFDFFLSSSQVSATSDEPSLIHSGIVEPEGYPLSPSKTFQGI